MLRWLACSQLPDVYTKLQSDKKVTWPEATVFSRWWTAAEDFILEHMLSSIREHNLQGHVSCHFDGILLGRSLAEAIEGKVEHSMVDYLQEKIYQGTSMRIRLKEKTLLSFDATLTTTFEAWCSKARVW